MNIQFVIRVYAMLTYLKYLCKPEHTMSELLKKTSKKAYETRYERSKHEVSTYEAIKRVLCLPMRH